MIFRTEILRVALPIPGRISMHDVWIGLLAGRLGKVSFDPVVLSLYRRHGGNQSAMTPSTIFRIIGWRIYLGFALLCRQKAINKTRRNN